MPSTPAWAIQAPKWQWAALPAQKVRQRAAPDLQQLQTSQPPKYHHTQKDYRVIPKQFEFGHSTTKITENDSPRIFGEVD